MKTYKSRYNIIEEEQEDLTKLKSKLKSINNYNIEILSKYLNKLKFEIIKSSSRVTDKVDNIILRDGSLRAIELIENDIKTFYKPDWYIDRIEWKNILKDNKE